MCCWRHISFMQSAQAGKPWVACTTIKTPFQSVQIRRHIFCAIHLQNILECHYDNNILQFRRLNNTGNSGSPYFCCLLTCTRPAELAGADGLVLHGGVRRPLRRAALDQDSAGPGRLRRRRFGSFWSATLGVSHVESLSCDEGRYEIIQVCCRLPNSQFVWPAQ